MLNPYDNFHRVFFHELGHFVSHIINQKYHNGLGISKVHLIPIDMEYEGFVTPLAYEGYIDNTPPPIDRLVQTIFCLEHGCIFEAYLFNSCIEDCVKEHGRDDYMSRGNMLGCHAKYGLAEELTNSTNSYLELLKANKILDIFLTLNPDNYISEKSNDIIIINHTKLRKDIESMIQSYESFYEAEFEKQCSILDVPYIQAPA